MHIIDKYICLALMYQEVKCIKLFNAYVICDADYIGVFILLASMDRQFGKYFHGTPKYAIYGIIKGMKVYRIALVRRAHETICTFA